MSLDVGSNAAIYRWSRKVATRTLDGTAFILADSRMISLNPLGTWIWELCREGRSLDDIVAAVVREYETTPDVAARDASSFLDALAERGMLDLATEVPSTHATPMQQTLSEGGSQ